MPASDREIERKFLVIGDAWRAGARALACRQGYLLATPELTIRVRVMGDDAWLTLKGRTEGISRAEFELPMPPAQAADILERLCPPAAIIEKTRHVTTYAGRTWEIDEFAGANRGLVVAEVELESEDAPLAVPPWAGAEVSTDPRYLNANLIRQPYASWGQE